MVQVLLVEDDLGIRTALRRSLELQHHVVHAVGTGTDAIAALSQAIPDVVVLDLGLPDLDGSKVLDFCRVMGPVPVIVATARDDDREVVRLLDAGADDYLIKPFSAAQLEARIRAVLRRVNAADERVDPTLTVGDIVLDPVARTAALDGRELELTRKEFDLLAVLMAHVGEVVTKQTLLAEVWQQPWGGGDRTVDVHLSWLRRKLGETAAKPLYLISVRGVGVKMVDPGP